MTKQEFVDAVASKANLSRRDAGAAVDAVLDTVSDALKRRDTITFTGFGKFSTSERAAREGVNPRNPAEKVQIPAAIVPKFSAGRQLRSATLAKAADELREEAAELTRSHGAYREQISDSRRKLREIAEAS
jgi:DNA-binding protein HU-beta